MARRGSARGARGRRSIGALGAALLLGAGVACTPLPPIPPPEPPPPAESGDVLVLETSTFSTDPITGAAAPGTEAWRVLYRTEDVHGNPIDVTGAVIAPTAPWLGGGPRPVVSYGVGTRGLGDECAPSSTLANGGDYEALLGIAPLLARGWAVAVTDYQGLGTPGRHTYMVGPAQGKAALDIVRAAAQIPGSDVTAASKVGVMGYSQGGATAGWAAELAPTYAPELNLVGVAAGGVPADLAATGEFLDGTLFSAFAFMAALGADAAYPELDLPSYLNAEGQQLYDDHEDTCLVSVDGLSVLVGTAFRHIDDFTTTNPLGTPIWQDRLGRSTLGRTAPEVPVYQYHSLFDEIVPFAPASDLRDAWCDAGAQVTWNVLPLAEHALGLVQGAPSAVSFLAARFAGLPAGDNC